LSHLAPPPSFVGARSCCVGRGRPCRPSRFSAERRTAPSRDTHELALNERRFAVDSSFRNTILALLLFVVSGSSWADENTSPDPLTLHDLVQEALHQNPDVQMTLRQVEAKQARVPQAGALPDPMLISGVLNEGRPIPFETLGTKDFSEVYVGVSQDLPYPGKRGLRENVAREEVTAAKWAYEAVRRSVAAQVAETYYDLYSV